MSERTAMTLTATATIAGIRELTGKARARVGGAAEVDRPHVEHGVLYDGEGEPDALLRPAIRMAPR
jgi:hypothetical protein